MSTRVDAWVPQGRGLYCNRTLNLRSIKAIGYDMDYTLIHYHVDEWERAAFEHARAHLLTEGWPVADLAFDPDAFTLGLTFDLDLGNLVKATRFGYVVRAQHGADVLSFDEQRRAYDGTVIELRDDRFEFMNTLFELSRASLWTQLVAMHDQRPLPGPKAPVAEPEAEKRQQVVVHTPTMSAGLVDSHGVMGQAAASSSSVSSSETARRRVPPGRNPRNIAPARSTIARPVPIGASQYIPASAATAATVKTHTFASRWRS